ncbi:MAG: KH domain-containing protein [Candidatus Polarisedimenticolia bacterium]
MKELLELIARSLVDRPDDVSVSEIDEGDETFYEIQVSPDDLGKLIGRQGRTVRALRTLLGAAGMKRRRRLVLEIVE